jgi:hypothetical protein
MQSLGASTVNDQELLSGAAAVAAKSKGMLIRNPHVIYP